MNNQQQNSAHEHVGSSPSAQHGNQTVAGCPRVIVVKAIHEYHPVNNDELHIQPGNLITITNPEDGGWWEGTLGSKTGWFPSNYVLPVEDFDVATADKFTAEANCADEYKSVIVNELIESESAYIREMEEFYETVLKNMNALVQYHGDPVVGQLQSAYSGLISAHKTHILGPLQAQMAAAAAGGGVAGLRVGKQLMGAASDISAAHTSYCNQHPKFVQFVERNQEKLSAAFGDQSGVLKIITLLSAPFRRVEKYGNTLNELERYVEQFNVDRGDLQRGVSYYRNLEKTLTSLRKQKEMELEVLTPGAIKDFEGPDVTLLGDIILMNLLFVGRDKQPRYFVLFSNTILILAYDNLSNTLTYKGRIYVSGVTVSCCDGDESVVNGFEISGPTLHPILVQCPSSSVRNTWLSNLNELLRATRCYSTGIHNNNQLHFNVQLQKDTHQKSLSVGSVNGIVSMAAAENHHVIGALSPPVQAWNITRLRPSAPYNPFLNEYRAGGSGSVKGERSSSSSSGFERGGGGGSFKFKSGSFSGVGFGGSGIGSGVSGQAGIVIGVSNEEDLCVLGIVDGFCGQNNRSSATPVHLTRNNPINKNLTNTNSPPVNIPPRFRSNAHHGGTPPSSVLSQQNINLQHQIAYKSLPQLVCNLREDVNHLNDKIGLLQQQLEEDRSFRVQLIELITKLGGNTNSAAAVAAKAADLRNGNL